ncbi:MAG: hypothetical protein R2734_20520 [Nocardioides sp.]
MRADATSWQGEGYDLAVVAYSQLAAAQRAAAVRNAFDALAAGGSFLFVAHDSSNLTEGHGGPQDPTVLMSAEDVSSPTWTGGPTTWSAPAAWSGSSPAAWSPARTPPARTACAYDVLVRLTRR